MEKHEAAPANAGCFPGTSHGTGEGLSALFAQLDMRAGGGADGEGQGGTRGQKNKSSEDGGPENGSKLRRIEQ